jgi:hypothetical protein
MTQDTGTLSRLSWLGLEWGAWKQDFALNDAAALVALGEDLVHGKLDSVRNYPLTCSTSDAGGKPGGVVTAQVAQDSVAHNHGTASTLI